MLEGGKRGYRITLGGHWGRVGGAGIEVPKVLEDDESVLAFIERTLAFYRDNGETGERFYKTLARIGFEKSLEMIG